MGLTPGDRSLARRSAGGAGILLLPPEGCAPGVGAQVGPHRCGVPFGPLRPGTDDYRMGRLLVAALLCSGGTGH
jgi:hypothetical protein